MRIPLIILLTFLTSLGCSGQGRFYEYCAHSHICCQVACPCCDQLFLPNMVYDNWVGENSEGISPAEGWRTDTLNGGYNKTVHHNPYLTLDNFQKEKYDSGFVYYRYQKGLKYTGPVADEPYTGGYIEFRANCINGLLQGKGTIYAGSGERIAEGNFTDGEIIGEWTYYEGDEISEVRTYVKGKAFPSKYIRYDLDGNIQMEAAYLDDWLVSFSKEFKNGQLFSQTTLIENNRKTAYDNDVASLYSYEQYTTKGTVELSGQLLSSDFFGYKRIGTWYFYNEKGEVTKTEVYKNGNLMEGK